MQLRLDAVINEQATFVLTNPTKAPATIVFEGVDVYTNEVWVASPDLVFLPQPQVLHAGKTLEVRWSMPRWVNWRARFQSIEKQRPIAALRYRIGLQNVRKGERFNVFEGEVYHNFRLVSEDIPGTSMD